MTFRRARGFTLIELLTVIAIIAILAAILFPVFASAKDAAKKTATISNIKQTGTALLAYVGDFDDLLPLACPSDTPTGSQTGVPGAVLWSNPVQLPAGWDPTYPQDDTSAWVNATHPYRKDYGILEGQGLPTLAAEGTDYAKAYAKPKYPYYNINFSYNGLLHAYPYSAVALPAQLTLLWEGEYKMNVKGYSQSKPVLRCSARSTAPCVFNPAEMPQQGATDSQNRGDAFFPAFAKSASTVWVFGKGMIFVSVDLSTKYRQLGGNGGGTVNAYDDFGRTYSNTGEPLTVHRCQIAPGAPYYSSFFRPDSTFTYPFGESASSCIR